MIPTSTATSAPAQAAMLRARGLALCKPNPGTKNPTERGWSTRSLEADDFVEGDLIGIVCGPLSDANRPGHALIIIDLDSTDAVERADDYLPSTNMVEGRPGKPSSHRYYLVTCESIPEWAHSPAEQGAAAAREQKGHPGPFKKPFDHTETNQRVIDFLGTGGQAVCPPSIHAKSGELREWVGGEPGEPAVVTFADLWGSVCKLALACGAKIPYTGESLPTHTNGHSGSPFAKLHASNGADVRTRAIAYLSKCDPAVSNQGGSNDTYWPARVVCWGFDLGEDAGFDLLWEHFNPRCLPPWTEAELRHKCRDANTLPFGKPRGWLLNEDRRPLASHTNGRATTTPNNTTAEDLLLALLKQASVDVGAALLAALKADSLSALAALKAECPGDVEAFLFGLRNAGAKTADVNRLRSAIGAEAKRLRREAAAERSRRRVEHRTQQSAGAIFRNFMATEHVAEDGEAETQREGLPAQAIERHLLTLSGGWPKRVGAGPGKLLFVEDPGPTPLFLENANQLFAWIGRQLPGDGTNPIEWPDGENLVSESRFHAHLRQTVEAYDAVEPFPHHPPMRRHYYMHQPPRGGDGKALRRLLKRYRPATLIDEDLLLAFFLQLLWGGPPGGRPAWLFTSSPDDPEKGRGVGKSTVAKHGARLVGGHIDLDPNEKMADARTRLLSPSALTCRVVLLDNVKSLKFSWGELEGLITSDIVSGHMLYHGEATRPNTLTYVLTLNGASLSKDMAQRCVTVHLDRPEYTGPWEEETLAMIEEHRWEIVGDILAELQRPVPPPHYIPWRWATWGAQVLAHVPDPVECQKVILERQGDVDDDKAEADMVRAAFTRNLSRRGHDPDRDVVFIPAEDAAIWLSIATNEKRASNKASAYLNTLAIPELRRSARVGERGWRWQGRDSSPLATAMPLGVPPPPDEYGFQ